jgi:large subunit ribosomal protein L31
VKKNIHPNYHEITLILTDGTSYNTRSTWGKEGDVMRLETDRTSHHAWVGGTQRILDTGQLSRFNKRFKSFGLDKQ